MSIRCKALGVLLAATSPAFVSLPSADAAIKYWDTNGGTTPGAGATPTGTWDTTLQNWNTGPDGDVAPAAWVAGDSAVFSAGTDATNPYTVTLSGVQTAAAATFEEGITTIAGSALSMGTNTITVNANATLSTASGTAITFATGGGYVLNGGTLRSTGTGGGSFVSTVSKITLNAAGGTIEGATAAGLTILETNVVISGPGSLRKTGPGIVAVVAAQTYLGSTTVDGGELRIRTAGSTHLPIATDMIVNSPGIFNLNGVSQQIGSLSGSGNVGTGAGTLTIIGPASTIFTGAVKNIANAGGGVTTGNGRIVKGGAGILTFNGLNDINGSVTINGGGIVVNPGASLSGAIADITVTAGTLTLNNAAQTIENLATTAGASVVLGTGHTLTSATTSTANTVSAAVISGPGAFVFNSNLVGSATGRLTFSALNTYAGDTTITRGTIRYGLNNAVPNGAGKGNVIVNGTLDMNTFSGAINGLSGTGIVDNLVAGTPSFTVGNNAQTSSFGGTIRNTAGTLGLVKTDVGTLTLTGANSYIGSTTVNGGVLLLANTAAPAVSATSSVAINGSGSSLVLGASEQVSNAAAFSLNGGTFDTGGFDEVVGFLNLASTSIIDMGATLDVASPGSILKFFDSGAAAWVGTLSVLNYTGTINVGGGLDQLFVGDAAGRLAPDQLSSIRFFADAGSIPIIGTTAQLATGEVVVVVPEPTSLTLLGLGAIGLIRRRRA